MLDVLNAIFDRFGSKLDEFDLVPVLSEADAEFHPFVVAVTPENSVKLGIPFQIVPALYTEASRGLIEAKQQSASQATSAARSSSSSSSWPEHAADLNSEIVRKLQATSRAVLMINAENYTAWNARKFLLTAKAVALQDELLFLALVFRKHPKSGEAFAHRRFVLQRLLINDPPAIKQTRLAEEFAICTTVANSYASNYFSWSHRTWLLEQVASDKDMVNTELETIKAWTAQHPQDHSGCHYLQQVLLARLRTRWPVLSELFAGEGSLALKNAKQVAALLSNANCNDLAVAATAALTEWREALNESAALLELHADNEALFHHRRFLVYHASLLAVATGIQASTELLQQETTLAQTQFAPRSFGSTPSAAQRSRLLSDYLSWLSSLHQHTADWKL